MQITLSIRVFTDSSFTHAHEHHQIVIALAGGAYNHTDLGDGGIGPGQGIVFPAGCGHRCDPDDGSRFLVADLSELPEPLLALRHPIISIPAPFLTYCRFVEERFAHRLDPALERDMGELFFRLLETSAFSPGVDPRIARVLELLERDVSAAPSLAELASAAALSKSRFKTLFKKETGKTAGEYLRALRMEKARALLAHTDYPVGVVAEMTGYGDLSAFSRQFAKYHGRSPRDSRKR